MSTEQRSHMRNQIDLDDAMLSQKKDLVLSHELRVFMSTGM